MSILVLVLLFTLNSVVIYLEMDDNKEKSEELSQKIIPSLNFLYDLRRNISERATLITDWVYSPEKKESKEKLEEFHMESKNVFFEINNVAENYKISAWQDSIKNTSNEFLLQVTLEADVISSLTTSKDYLNVQKFHTARTHLEQDILPLSQELNKKISAYIRYTTVWRDMASKSIAESTNLIRQLTVLLVLEIFIFGFILSFLIESILIRPIIELKDTLNNLKKGIVIKKPVRRGDEIGAIQTAVNGLADRMDEMSSFALSVGQRSFETTFRPLSEHDQLGQSLVTMCDDLKKNISRLEETKKIAGIGYMEYNPSTTEIDCSNNIWNILDIERPVIQPTLADFLKHCSTEDTLNFQIQVRNCLKHDARLEMILPITSFKGDKKILSLSGKHFITADDMVGKIVIVMQDITQRKRAEDELKQAHYQMKTFFKNIDDVFFSYDPVTKQLLQISDACEKVYGYTEDDFRQNFKLIEEVVVTEDRSYFQEKKLELQIGNPVIFEYRINRKSGTMIWVETKITPSFDSQGKVIRLDGITSDISKRKENEEKLSRTNEDLLKTNSELDKFVYSVSHDLRAPLTSMQGIVELTELETNEELTARHMQMLEKSISKLDSFIADILNYSRNSRLDIRRENVNFKELLEDIASELQYMDGFDSTLVINNRINMEGEFYSDTSRLRIVLSNLISNAIRYKDAAKEKPFVKINVKANGDSVEIAVEDNGIGIKKEFHEKIFNMFYRVSEQSVGSGLGLYIVKETIEKLNGKITIDSVPGVGTKIYLQLPNLNLQ
jgi:PAS domain S-box-containing protein